MYRDEKQNINFYMYGSDESPAGTGKGEQNYYEISKQAGESGVLFEDPLFPADDSILDGCDPFTYQEYALEDGQFKIVEKNMEISWLRPTEISKMMGLRQAKFRGDYTQFGVNQGMVGDCWFLAVLADVALHPDCINTLVPEDNELNGFLTGAFHFRFWCKGKWVEVTIDDRLACFVKDGTCQTLFCKPTSDSTYWACLLEKAYAKMYGGYGRITGGLPADAMLDFTGGFVKDIDCTSEGRAEPGFPNILQTLRDGKLRKDIMAIGTFPEPPPGKEAVHDPNNPGSEAVSSEGMVGGHAYSVLDIQTLDLKSDPSKHITMVKLRNPWGNNFEWSGAFCDKDDFNWGNMSKDLRRSAADKLNDGEFWIPFNSLEVYMAALFTCRWSGKFRGSEEFFDQDGYTVFMDFADFTAKNSGKVSKPEDLFGKKSYSVILKPTKNSATQEVVKNGLKYNCTIAVDLIYLNYKKSGSDANIPEFGFYITWSPGQIYPSENIYESINTEVAFEPKLQTGFRRLNLLQAYPEGTLLIVPWVTKQPEQDLPFFLRISVEGTVYKYIW